MPISQKEYFFAYNHNERRKTHVFKKHENRSLCGMASLRNMSEFDESDEYEAGFMCGLCAKRCKKYCYVRLPS